MIKDGRKTPSRYWDMKSDAILPSSLDHVSSMKDCSEQSILPIDSKHSLKSSLFYVE